MFEWGWVVEPDPNYQLSTFTCANRSYKDGGRSTPNLSDSFYCNPEYDALYASRRTQIDPAERAETVKQMQQIVYDDAPTRHGLLRQPAGLPVRPVHRLRAAARRRTGRCCSSTAPTATATSRRSAPTSRTATARPTGGRGGRRRQQPGWSSAASWWRRWSSAGWASRCRAGARTTTSSRSTQRRVSSTRRQRSRRPDQPTARRYAGGGLGGYVGPTAALGARDAVLRPGVQLLPVPAAARRPDRLYTRAATWTSEQLRELRRDARPADARRSSSTTCSNPFSRRRRLDAVLRPVWDVIGELRLADGAAARHRDHALGGHRHRDRASAAGGSAAAPFDRVSAPASTLTLYAMPEFWLGMVLLILLQHRRRAAAGHLPDRRHRSLRASTSGRSTASSTRPGTCSCRRSP